MNNGWQRKRLKELSEAISTGPFGSVLHKTDYVDHGVPLVNPINIIDDRIVPDTSKLINEKTKRRLSNYVLQERDIVVGRRGEIGRCAVVSPTEAGWVCGTGSFFIRPLPSVNAQFLAHLIRSNEYREKLEQVSTGATMKNLSNTALGDLVVSIPPLAEQKRIVGILDEAFDGIATTKANAEKNLQNARALFESQLQSVFTQQDSSPVFRKLDEVCEEITVGHVGAMAKQYRDKGIPFLRSQNIRPFRVSLENVVFIDEAFHRSLAKSQLRPGDVAVVRTGYPGTAAVIPDSLPVCNCSDLVIVRPSPLANPHYLALFFNSSIGKELVAGRLVGAAQKHFNVTAAKQVAISFPPVTEQRRLVARMEEFGTETQHLESIYQQKLAKLDELKKSLLHQAFTGEL